MAGEKIAAAQAAVKASVDQTNDGKTEWCLVRFGGCAVSVLCRFTMDPRKLQAAADTLGTDGDTPYTYGREKALKYLVQRGRGQAGRLVILCDGQDNCPEHGGITQPEASAQLRQLMRIVQPATPAGGTGQ
jgi:Mg-chelatase subunit ChlD